MKVLMFHNRYRQLSGYGTLLATSEAFVNRSGRRPAGRRGRLRDGGNSIACDTLPGMELHPPSCKKCEVILGQALRLNLRLAPVD